MRPFLLALTALLLLASSLPALAADLRALIREIEDQHTGRSSHAVMTMQVRTEHWERNLSMEAWSLGRDRFLVRILDPPKERGVATLKVDQEVWNYLPKVDRTIKVPPSMMGGAWMGSHITNNDLVKAAKIDEDYDFELLAETDTHWRIDCLPKPEAAVVWGRIVYEVEKARRVPTVVDYYDEAGEKVRTMSFSDVRRLDDRHVPLRMAIQPLDTPDESTLLVYSELEFDRTIEPRTFTLDNLRSR